MGAEIRVEAGGELEGAVSREGLDGMISRPTVIVFGAGASHDYHFTLGAGLVTGSGYLRAPETTRPAIIGLSLPFGPQM